MESGSIENIFTRSKARLLADAGNEFLFLRSIPSGPVRAFAQYWLDKAEIGELEKFLETTSSPNLSQAEGKTIIPPACGEYIDSRLRHWSMLPEWGKQSRGKMFLRRGRLPAHLREGAGDDDLRRYAAMEVKWPTEKEIVKSFGKQFEVELLYREGSAEYRISRQSAPFHCETRLIISSKLRFIFYCHLLEDFQHPFALIDHAGDWWSRNWDLITYDNLESAVLSMRRIVSDFEGSWS